MTSLKMALRSIGANKLRAVLTMLGIIIGVIALVVLVSMVDSATNSITQRLCLSGQGQIRKTPGSGSLGGQRAYDCRGVSRHRLHRHGKARH